MLKGYNPVKLVFGRDTILPIKIRRIRNQYVSKIGEKNKDNTCKNSKRLDHKHKAGYKVILTKESAFKDETPYNGPFEITQCWTNGTVTLQCDIIKNRYNIRHIKLYKSDTKIGDNISEN